MAEDMKEKEERSNKPKRYDPIRTMVRIIALIMIICMVFAVAATCLFYIKYLIK